MSSYMAGGAGIGLAVLLALIAGVWIGRRTSSQGPGALADGAPGADIGINGPHLSAEIAAMRADVSRTAGMVRQLELDGARAQGQLAGHLARTGAETAALADATRGLKEMLSSGRARGQWGERMAEDVLRLAGLVENVNYVKQKGLAGGGIPDFTFLLPKDFCLHMDVKFPLDNYLRSVQATGGREADHYRDIFLSDVRALVRDLARRDYARSPASLECQLLFIPNEALFAFVQEHDRALSDEALAAGIVLCSPLTLFAVLSVVRQAVENFAVERKSRQILVALDGFAKQWENFVAQMDKVGVNLDRAQRDFEGLVGTRRRQVDRSLRRLDDLRSIQSQDEAELQ
ncbi:MAG: DNA recombination protein RmuC [Acidimicrobiales bacterium]